MSSRQTIKAFLEATKRQSLAMAEKEEHHKVQQLSTVRDQKVACGHTSELDQPTACY